MTDATYYLQGQTAVIEVTVKNRRGELVDPATIAAAVTKPVGPPLPLDVVRDDLGQFYAEVVCDTPGTWSWEVTTTGPNDLDWGRFHVSERS